MTQRYTHEGLLYKFKHKEGDQTKSSNLKKLKSLRNRENITLPSQITCIKNTQNKAPPVLEMMIIASYIILNMNAMEGQVYSTPTNSYKV